MRRWLLAATLLLASCAAGPQVFERTPFALLGDVPYSQPHANLLDAVIDEINASKPAFVVHLGDITGGKGPCTDEWFDARARQFARFSPPFVLVFGDNEWTDCHRTNFDPMERLAKIRQLFQSQTVPLPGFARQSAGYPEHVRWTHAGSVFVALNVPGSNNNLGRTAQMDAEHATRMRAVFAWFEEAAVLAQSPKVETLVVLIHANPLFEGRQAPSALPDGFAKLRAVLEETALKLGKPLVLVHGDTHRFRHDRPVPRAPGLVRIEVDGWPWIGWLKAGTTPDPAVPVAVERFLNPQSGTR